MAKKTTDIAQDMPVDVYLTVVVGPTLTKIQDELHELNKKVNSKEEHPSSSLSSSGTDDLAESIADKVISKMKALQETQTEQKEDDQDIASTLLNEAKEGVRKEVTTMVQSIGSLNTKLDTVISHLEGLKKKTDEYVKPELAEEDSKIKRYSRRMSPAVIALAAFLICLGAYHNSYHYWGERFFKLANDPMQTEQTVLDLKSSAFEFVKREFEKGHKVHTKSLIKLAESRLKLHKKAVKKIERERKRQTNKKQNANHEQ